LKARFPPGLLFTLWGSAVVCGLAAARWEGPEAASTMQAGQ
jgi:hypothetical protein